MTKTGYLIANKNNEFFNVQKGAWMNSDARATVFRNIATARAYANEFGLKIYHYVKADV